MEKTAYAGINTSISVYQTQLLKQSDYDAMLRANSIDEVTSVLQKSNYYLSEDLAQTKEFDSFLMSSLENTYDELYEQSPEISIVDLYALSYEYHNLKVLFKEWFSDKDFSHMYIKIGHHSVKSLRKAVRDDVDIKTLNRNMQEAIREVKDYFETYQDYDGISVILDRAYLEHLRSLTKDLKDRDVTHYIDMKIDFENLLMVARGINQGKSRGFLSSVMSDEGSIERELLLDLARNKDMSTIIDMYSRLPYGGKLAEFSSQEKANKIDVTKLEALIEETMADELRIEGLTAFGPMPLITYLHFKENEITNIRLILVGIDNELAEDTIIERMRPIYGS